MPLDELVRHLAMEDLENERRSQETVQQRAAAKVHKGGRGKARRRRR